MAGLEDKHLVFIGANFVAGGEWEEWFPDSRVHVLAAPEETTDALVDRVREAQELRPDIIVLLIGSNDFGERRSVEYVVRGIEYFLAKIRQEIPGVRVLVQSILPRGRERAADLREANIHLRQYARVISADYLDLWPALATEEGDLRNELSEDGFNLTAAGYSAWLGELRPALERVTEAPPMSRPITIITPPAQQEQSQ